MSAEHQGGGGRRRHLRNAALTRARAVVQTGSRAVRRHTHLLHAFSRQMIAVRVIDSANRLGAEVFMTAVPVLFVVAAFSPQSVREELVDSVRAVLGLRGASLEEVTQVFDSSDEDMRNAYGVLGIIITVTSATKCSRVLQRLCERSWHLPRAKARLIAWRWFVWLLIWLAALTLQSSLRGGLGTGEGLGILLAFVTSTLLWWWTQHFLLGGRLNWLPLLPGALLTAAGTAVLIRLSRYYMPGALNRSIAQFGPLGSVFTLLTWLIAVGGVVSVGIASGYLAAQVPAVGRWLSTPARAANRPQELSRTRHRDH